MTKHKHYMLDETKIKRTQPSNLLAGQSGDERALAFFKEIFAK